jgi:hypothetical protein
VAKSLKLSGGSFATAICTPAKFGSKPARISKGEIRFRGIPIIPYAIGLHVSNADAIRLHVDISGFSDMSPAPAS